MIFTSCHSLLLLLCIGVSMMSGPTLAGSDSKPTPVVIHATNKTSVPSIHYIVDAVECLKQAYEVYPDDVNRAKLYSDLFGEKHEETRWNVVIGYTALYINSTYYVETSVSGGSSFAKDSKKDKDKSEKLVLIFSVD